MGSGILHHEIWNCHESISEAHAEVLQNRIGACPSFCSL